MNKYLLVKKLLTEDKITKEEGLLLLSSSKSNLVVYLAGLILLLVGQAFAKAPLIIAGQALPDTNLVQVAGFILLFYQIAIKLWREFQNKKDVKSFNNDDSDINIQSLPTDTQA